MPEGWSANAWLRRRETQGPSCERTFLPAKIPFHGKQKNNLHGISFARRKTRKKKVTVTELMTPEGSGGLL